MTDHRSRRAVLGLGGAGVRRVSRRFVRRGSGRRDEHADVSRDDRGGAENYDGRGDHLGDHSSGECDGGRYGHDDGAGGRERSHARRPGRGPDDGREARRGGVGDPGRLAGSVSTRRAAAAWTATSTSAPVRRGGNPRDVRVELAERLDTDATLYAVLHYDDPANREMDFPDGDPVVTVDGEVVRDAFRVTVA